MKSLSMLDRALGNTPEQPDDILKGYSLRGPYRSLHIVLGLLVGLLIFYNWFIHASFIAAWLNQWGLDHLSSSYTGVVPFIWASYRLGFSGVFVFLATSTAISALLSTLQNRGISPVHFGLALGALLLGTFACQILALGKASAFALINAIVVLAGSVAIVIYLVRLVRGLFVMRYGIGNWFTRIFKNLFLTILAAVCVEAFYYSQACIIMLIGGALTAIILLVLKPVENLA